MVTKISLYNGALGFIGTERLHDTTGLTENVKARLELDREYDGALAYMLGLAGWKFAIRTSELTADTSIDPEFGLEHAFAIPSDFVRLAAISTTGDFVPGSEPEYQEENGRWYSSTDTIYVRYVSSGVTYGLNLALYPQYYVEALEAWLAYKSTIPISRDRGDRNDILAQHQRNLKIAKGLHALDDPVKFKPPGTWTRSRMGPGRTWIRNGRMGW